MAFGGPHSSCVRPGAHSARRLRSLAFLCSSSQPVAAGAYAHTIPVTRRHLEIVRRPAGRSGTIRGSRYHRHAFTPVRPEQCRWKPKTSGWYI